MKSWLKSFFITFLVSISVGVVLLFLMDSNDIDKLKQDIPAELQLDKKNKRMATKEDIIDILQVIVFDQKKVIQEVLIDPICKTIKVENFRSDEKFSDSGKTLEKLYDYGGIKFLMKEINKNFNKNIDKYIVIEGRDKLEDLLDIVGNIDIKGVFDRDPEINISKEYGILDEESIINLFESQNNNFIISEITRQYYIQKICLLDKEIGEEILKKIINTVNSNISYKNYKNLTEINIENFK